MQALPEISIVIPVYNEEKSIAWTLNRVKAFMALKGKPWEVIVSDDGSKDQTAKIVQAMTQDEIRLVRSERNEKKGAAVKRAVLVARGERILVTDVDLSTPIKELDKLLKALDDGADVAIGSRVLREKNVDVRQSLKRKLAGRIFNLLVSAIVFRGVKDTQCGFKCFTRNAAVMLFGKQRMNGFSFDVEILYLAKKNGLSIREVPVMWMQGESSHVRLFSDSIRMARDLFTIRQLHG